MGFSYTIAQPDMMLCSNWLGKCYTRKAVKVGIFVVYPGLPIDKPNPTLRWYCSWKCLIEDVVNLEKTVVI